MTYESSKAWFDVYQDWQLAGFTPDQAFQLVLAGYTAGYQTERISDRMDEMISLVRGEGES